MQKYLRRGFLFGCEDKIFHIISYYNEETGYGDTLCGIADKVKLALIPGKSGHCMQCVKKYNGLTKKEKKEYRWLK